LLQTPPESVPHELAQAVIDFAKATPNVTRAFVGQTEMAEDFQKPVEQLAAGFVLADESDAALQTFGDLFYSELPAELQAGGCNVLAPAAVDDWSDKAQQVFVR
jgi:hypothetical protein